MQLQCQGRTEGLNLAAKISGAKKRPSFLWKDDQKLRLDLKLISDDCFSLY